MHGHGVKTDPQGALETALHSCAVVLSRVDGLFLAAGNIFEGDWKEGKPQLKGEKGKGLQDLLPWLNETVRHSCCRPLPPLHSPAARDLSRTDPLACTHAPAGRECARAVAENWWLRVGPDRRPR